MKNSEREPGESDLTFNQYEEKALATINESLTHTEQLVNAALGLAGESGEVAELVKKHIFHGHGIGSEKLKEELGDILWYIAQACYALGFTVEQIAEYNNEKLAKRYPKGFNHQDSIDRKV